MDTIQNERACVSGWQAPLRDVPDLQALLGERDRDDSPDCELWASCCAKYVSAAMPTTVSTALASTTDTEKAPMKK
jgi:hypothetical protein